VNLQNITISGKYHIKKMIAEGDMSTVWLARDITNNSNIVVKVLKSDNISYRIEDLIRFKNEVLIISKLEIPGTVLLYEVGEINELHYMVMEYIDGVNIQELIRNKRNFSVIEAVKIIYELCKILIPLIILI
jgi:eukaryotic-like serine/threonine-protein kinase